LRIVAFHPVVVTATKHVYRLNDSMRCAFAHWFTAQLNLPLRYVGANPKILMTGGGGAMRQPMRLPIVRDNALRVIAKGNADMARDKFGRWN